MSLDKIITDLQDLHRRVTDADGDPEAVSQGELTEVVADLISDVIWMADVLRKKEAS